MYRTGWGMYDPGSDRGLVEGGPGGRKGRQTASVEERPEDSEVNTGGHRIQSDVPPTPPAPTPVKKRDPFVPGRPETLQTRNPSVDGVETGTI